MNSNEWAAWSKSWCEWIEEQSNWANLTKVMKSPVLSLLARLPLVALVVLVIAKAEEQPALRKIIGAELRETIAWNASLLLLGGAIIFVAWIIYQIRVPHVCRRHADLEDFLSEGVASKHVSLAAAKASVERVTLPGPPPSWSDGASAPLRRLMSPALMRKELSYSNNETRLYLYHWVISNHSDRACTSACWALLLAGAILAGIPTVTTFWRAARWLVGF